ncbi:iron-containing alcohol dehydrogenase, partial [Cupriavidus basilensis]
MAFIYYLTHIHLDFGTIGQLKAECERIGIRRPLVVTDKGVVAAGVARQAIDALGGLPHELFDETPSNPTEAMVKKAAAQYRESGCDGLVAVGGGSSIDLAKGIAILATHPGELTTYATIEGGSGKITERAA